MQQPPPRKAKIGQDLKNVQHDQWTKLQGKHQSDTDLLDDVREFSKQRAAIEKIYAQSLQKLAAQYLQKKSFPASAEEAEEEQRNRTATQVWKALLDQTEKIARARLTAAESISTQITDTIKLQKNSRAITLKKSGDLVNVWHEEVQASVRDVIKARKNYADAEKIAQDARAKAAEAENRLTKGSVKFFQSRSSLEKTTAKLISRQTTCNRRSAHMRNEYLLCIAAANAHRKRLYETDVLYLMETLDGDIYDRLRNHFRVFSTTEIETSTYVKSCFQRVSDEAELVNRCYHHEQFLNENPIFSDLIQYVFDPVENDEVSTLVMDSTELLYLEREARRWSTQVAKESIRIDMLARQMDECQPYVNQLRGSENSSDSGFSQDKDPELKLDVLRETRRTAETNKLKAEAKLNVMREAGIDVDEWLSSAYEAIAKEAEIEAQTKLQQQQDLQQKQHHLEEQQHYTSSQNVAQLDTESEDPHHAPHVRELHSYSISSFDSMDDFDPPYEDQVSQGSSGPSIGRQYPARCTAIFDYTAQRDDELTIREKDVLELMEESEGDGWVKARNQQGHVGYVPENYIEVERQRLSFCSSHKGDSVLVQQNEILQHGSSQSSVDYEIQAVMASHGGGAGEDSGAPTICMVRALYDYDASCPEELSFIEGTVFKLIRRDENGVDDGFWEGELNGRVGVFPSLLVEELDSESRQGSSDGEMFQASPDYESAGPSFAPPDFAPPPLPPTIAEDVVHDPDYEEVDKGRPASASELASPRGEYGYMMPTTTVEAARSVPASPVSMLSSTSSSSSASIKPVRAAPPPPSAKKKAELSNLMKYENTPVSYV